MTCAPLSSHNDRFWLFLCCTLLAAACCCGRTMSNADGRYTNSQSLRHGKSTFPTQSFFSPSSHSRDAPTSKGAETDRASSTRARTEEALRQSFNFTHALLVPTGDGLRFRDLEALAVEFGKVTAQHKNHLSHACTPLFS